MTCQFCESVGDKICEWCKKQQFQMKDQCAVCGQTLNNSTIEYLSRGNYCAKCNVRCGEEAKYRNAQNLKDLFK